MLDEIQRVKSEGFDPSSETYMERMKGVSSGPSWGEIESELRDYLVGDQKGVIRTGRDVSGDRFILDKETWEKNKPYIDKGKVNIDPNVVKHVQKVGDDYLVDREGAEMLSKGYFRGVGEGYDAIRNEGLTGSDEFARKTGKQGEANLKSAIINDIPDNKLQEWGKTRSELIDRFVNIDKYSK